MKLLNKFFSFISVLLLLFYQVSLPILVLAQESVNESSQSGEVDSSTPSQPSLSENLTNLEASGSALIDTDSTESQSSAVLTPPIFQTNSDGSVTTTNPVSLNTTYKAPQNDKVTITFTRLPDPSGTLTIQEVRLSPQEKEELGAVSNIAYEITSTMEDGTFEYTLTLPTPTTENVEVKYSEDGNSFVTLGNVTAQEETLTIAGLTHFTLFVVTTVSDFGSGVSGDTTITDVGGGNGDVINTLGAEGADQSQVTGTTAQIFDSTTWLAQTFTAGISGLLAKVRLSVRVQSGDDKSGNVTVELRTTSGGVPTSTVLASTTVDPNTLPSVQGNFDFSFSSPASVSLGTTYAIVVYRGATGNASNYDWYRASAAGGNNPYAGGRGYTSANSGVSWTLRNSGNGDQRFTTFIRSYPTSGTQTSDVLNTGLATTKFVRLSWTEDLPTGTDITFEIRASSSAFLKIDGAPAWISLGSANSPASLTAALPDKYQYFQWRAALSGTESSTPTLHDVTTTYLFPPTASPVGGDYFSDQTVTLSSEAGTTIRYTTDGTTPTASTGSIYTGPIAIGTDTTLKTVAVDTDGNTSSVLSETYSIAPVISAESSNSVSSSSVTITWITDDPSTSRVLYDTVSHPVLGAAPNYGYANSTIEDSAKVTSHSVLASGLSAGTTYYFRTASHGSPETVGSENTITTAALAAASTSGDGGGTVLGASTTCSDTKPGSAPTLISTSSGLNSVTLTWSQALNPVSYYLITYGLSPGVQSFGNPNVGGKGTTSYTVSGLSGETTYYFKVRAGNGCAPGDFSNELSATARGAVVSSPAAGFAPGVLGEATPSARIKEEGAVKGTKVSAITTSISSDKLPKSESSKIIIITIALFIFSVFSALAGFLLYKKPTTFDLFNHS